MSVNNKISKEVVTPQEKASTTNQVDKSRSCKEKSCHKPEHEVCVQRRCGRPGAGE